MSENTQQYDEFESPSNTDDKYGKYEVPFHTLEKHGKDEFDAEHDAGINNPESRAREVAASVPSSSDPARSENSRAVNFCGALMASVTASSKAA